MMKNQIIHTCPFIVFTIYFKKKIRQNSSKPLIKFNSNKIIQFKKKKNTVHPIRIDKKKVDKLP